MADKKHYTVETCTVNKYGNKHTSTAIFSAISRTEAKAMAKNRFAGTDKKVVGQPVIKREY